MESGVTTADMQRRGFSSGDTRVEPPRIWIVDPGFGRRELLAGFLSEVCGMTVVGTSETRENLLKALTLGRIDCVVMDTIQKDGGGLIGLKEIMATEKPPKVLFYTDCFEEEGLRIALAWGAHGYISRSDELVELVAGIYRAVKGDCYVSSTPGKRVIYMLEKKPRRKPFNSVDAFILKGLCEGLSFESIAEANKIDVRSVSRNAKRIHRIFSTSSLRSLRKKAVDMGLVGSES